MTARQSARVIELHGNDGHHNVEARAAREIKPDPIAPSPPEWLSPGARAVWRYLAPELERDALLTRRDREAFAFLCTEADLAATALGLMRPDRRKGYDLLDVDEGHQGRTRRHPALMAYAQATARFERWARHFGLSPLTRIPLELGAPAPPADDEDDDALEG